MSERQESRFNGPAIACVALLLVVALYVAGYFGLCTDTSLSVDNSVKCRTYRTEWEAKIYLPLAMAESIVTGLQVEAEESRSNVMMAPKITVFTKSPNSIEASAPVSITP